MRPLSFNEEDMPSNLSDRNLLDSLTHAERDDILMDASQGTPSSKLDPSTEDLQNFSIRRITDAEQHHAQEVAQATEARDGVETLWR